MGLPPPSCPCIADFDASGGTPDANDITAFFDAWLLGDPGADADCSGGTPGIEDIEGRVLDRPHEGTHRKAQRLWAMSEEHETVSFVPNQAFEGLSCERLIDRNPVLTQLCAQEKRCVFERVHSRVRNLGLFVHGW